MGLFLWIFASVATVSLMIWEFLCWLFKDLKKTSNVKISFEEIMSVSQGSVLGRIILITFFNDLLYFILVVWAHNFADDGTPISFAKTIENLNSILKSESETAINWFKDKFQVVIFDKRKEKYPNQIIKIVQKEINEVC